MRGQRIWAEINLSALQHNLRVLQKNLSPGTDILAVVKADAYGHGAVATSWCALQSGCRMLGVGDSSEALELRAGGITGPILILGAIIEEEIPRVVEHDIAVTLHSTDFLKHLNAEARRLERKLSVHLKIDTGMGRLGLPPRRAVAVAREIGKYPFLDLTGVCTHIATRRPEVTREQLALFQAALAELEKAGIRPPLIHAANSSALFSVPESRFNLVRPGIALYGMDPGDLAPFGLRPVLSLRTRVAFLKSVPTGSGIGYEHTFRASRPTRLAVCPVGYNDGYPHLLSNRASALLRGRRVPLVGTVTMDYSLFDVTDVPEAAVGDEMTLIGRDGTAEIRVEELAALLGTIPYAIPCGLGKRVRRIYLRDGVETTPGEWTTIRSSPQPSAYGFVR